MYVPVCAHVCMCVCVCVGLNLSAVGVLRSDLTSLFHFTRRVLRSRAKRLALIEHPT